MPKFVKSKKKDVDKKTNAQLEDYLHKFGVTNPMDGTMFKIAHY
jgi:hypothetical protein